MYGYSLGKDRKAIEAGIEEAYAVFPRLSDRRAQLASTLSGGEQQMLGLSKALIIAPRVLLIDEFSLGLAPVIVGQLMETVRRLNERGTAVLLVEQSVNVALSLVDRVYFMEKGRITYEGRAEDLRSDPELVAALSMGGAHVEEIEHFDEVHEAEAHSSTNGHVPVPLAEAAVASVIDAPAAPTAVAPYPAPPAPEPGPVVPEPRVFLPEPPSGAGAAQQPPAPPAPVAAMPQPVEPPVPPAPAAPAASAPPAYAAEPTVLEPPFPVMEPTPLEPRLPAGDSVAAPAAPFTPVPVPPPGPGLGEAPAQEGPR
jgi:hypothetical protein